MRKHALLSASSAARWLACTPSARLEDSYSDTTSIYAKEGTLAHAIGECILRKEIGELTKSEFNAEMQRLKENELFYPAMLSEVALYTDYCLERYRLQKEAQMWVETRIHFDSYVPDGFGTGDCILISNGLLEVIDLKFGKGVFVEVEENPQLMLYGLGALSALQGIYDISKVRLTIAQVRLNEINSWEISAAELRNWGTKTVKPKAEAAYKGEGDTIPGPHCTFCRARKACKARAQYLQGTFNAYQDKKLTKKDYAEILKVLPEIKAWVRDIEDETLACSIQGGKIPGYKLVEGRSIRRIKDESSFIKTLKKEGFSEVDLYKPRELQGITALEKLVGGKKLNDLCGSYIDKPQGKPTLVPESDKRPELGAPENEFDFTN